MDFNTAHDIVHEKYGNQSSQCTACNGDTKGNDVIAKAGEIIKEQRQKRSQMNSGMYAADKTPLDKSRVTIKNKKVYPFVEIKASEDGTLPNEIQIMPIGEWDTVPYGKLIISHDDLQEMVDNYNKGVRAGVPIDVDHDGKAAAGWINSLKVKEDGLYAAVEWTPLGAKLLGEKQYRFFSPEFNPEYVDPENKHLQIDNVLIAGSLVNRPLFKELQPLVAHEAGKNSPLTTTKIVPMLFIENNMNAQELLKKKEAGQALTASEQDFLKTYLFGDNADDTEGKRKGKADSDGTDFKKSTKAAAGDKAKAMDDGTADDDEDDKKDNLKAKETRQVSITASELRQLKEDALLGKAAAEKLANKEIEDTVNSWMFSEDGGHFQPALKSDLVTFVRSLDADQRKLFGELVDKMPEQKLLFNEIGGNEEFTAGKAADGVTIAANELIEKAKANGKTLTFGEAAKQAIHANPALADYKLTPVQGRVIAQTTN
jgi:phage I-like protein